MSIHDIALESEEPLTSNEIVKIQKQLDNIHFYVNNAKNKLLENEEILLEKGKSLKWEEEKMNYRFMSEHPDSLLDFFTDYPEWMVHKIEPEEYHNMDCYIDDGYPTVICLLEGSAPTIRKIQLFHTGMSDIEQESSDNSDLCSESSGKVCPTKVSDSESSDSDSVRY